MAIFNCPGANKFKQLEPEIIKCPSCASDEVDTKDKDKLRKMIDKIFLTETGKSLAQKLYLG